MGELSYRGYYQGLNVSYNAKEMIKNGYRKQERSAHELAYEPRSFAKVSASAA